MFFWTPVDALLNLKNKYCMKTAWQRNTIIMIPNRMMFYSLVFCDDIVQNIWFVTSSLVHILQLNISARFVSGAFLEDNLLIAIILIYAGKAQLISNLHFHQACSINMRFIWWITKCIIKLLLYFFLPGIFIVKMYFSYILVCFPFRNILC